MKDLKFSKMISKAANFIFCGFLCACALTPEAKLARAYKRVSKAPFSQWPAIYVQLEKEGYITPATRENWQKVWEKYQKKLEETRIADAKAQEAARIAAEKAYQKAQEERRRWWNSLTPGQQMQYEMQQQQMAFQAQQQREQMISQAYQLQQANMQATFQNLQQGIQQQQNIDAYNRRTQVLSQPVNVQHSGYIDHTINVYNH